MTNLPDRADSPKPQEMRASDADRDQVAHVLREAAAEGRLTLEEVDERLSAVYAAKAPAALAPLTRDLPAPGSVSPAPSYAASSGGDAPGWKTGVAIMAEFRRQGV